MAPTTHSQQEHDDTGCLPEGFWDLFDVSQLPSTHPGTFVDQRGKNIRATEEQGFLCFGQYRKGYPVLLLRACFSILIDNNTADDRYILVIDVYDHQSGRVLVKRVITRKDFPGANEFCLFTLDFTPPGPQANMEFRIYYMGYAHVCADKIAIVDPTQASIQTVADLPHLPAPPELDEETEEQENDESEEVSPPPVIQTWQRVTIGQCSCVVQERNGEFTIKADGAIKDYADSFCYIYQSLYKGGKLNAYITCQESGAGVMFRETLEPDSRFIMVEGNRILWRAETGGKIQVKNSSDSVRYNWVRILRLRLEPTARFRGNSGPGEPNGKPQWRDLGLVDLPILPDILYIGIAATTDAVFQRLKITLL